MNRILLLLGFLVLAQSLLAQPVIDSLFVGLPMQSDCQTAVDAAIGSRKLTLAHDDGHITLPDGTRLQPNYAGFFDNHRFLKNAGKGNSIQMACMEDQAWIATMVFPYSDNELLSNDLNSLAKLLANRLQDKYEMKRENNSVLFYNKQGSDECGLVVGWTMTESGGAITIIYRKAQFAP